MRSYESPKCAWSGAAPDGEGTQVNCGRPARYYLEPPAGRRWYSCEEHLAQAKARVGGGAVLHEIPVRQRGAPTVRSSISYEVAET